MKFIRFIVSVILITVVFLSLSLLSASAGPADLRDPDIWNYGTTGGGSNPFTPRGYMIKTSSGLKFLNSRYDNSTGSVQYTGVENGLTYIDAFTKDKNGNKTNISYTLYALTDRNPETYQYLFAYKNGTVISNFGTHLGTPIRSSESSDFINGTSTMWAIPILDFKFEPGSRYEFGYNMGMRAHNGISLTLATDSKGRYIGYLRNPMARPESSARYESMKYTEYMFVSSYETKLLDSPDPLYGTDYYYNINFVPMRFSVRTYADLSLWENKENEIRSFMDTVTERDYKRNKYSREAGQALLGLLDSLGAKTENEIKYLLQDEANSKMSPLVAQAQAAFENFLSSGGTLVSDTEDYEAALKEAVELYAEVKDNTGTALGQYSKQQVELLGSTIDRFSGLTENDSQEDIDSAESALKSAIIKVKDSKVREETMTFIDRSTHIVVRTKSGSLPENTVMFVRPIYETMSDYDDVKAYFGKFEKILIYEIMFYQSDRVVHPEYSLKLQIPLGDITDDYNVSSYILNEGSAKKLQSITTDGYIISAASDTGTIVAACSKKTEDEKKEEATTKKTSESTSDKHDNKDDGVKTAKPDITLPETSVNEPEIKESEPVSEETEEVVLETPEDLGKTPDLPEEFMNLGEGEGEKTPDIAIEGENAPPVELSDVSIPQDEVKKEAEANYLLLGAGVFGLSSLLFGVTGLYRKMN